MKTVLALLFFASMSASAAQDDASQNVENVFNTYRTLSSGEYLALESGPSMKAFGESYQVRVINALKSAGKKIAIIRSQTWDYSDQVYLLGKDQSRRDCLIKIAKYIDPPDADKYLVAIICGR